MDKEKYKPEVTISKDPAAIEMARKQFENAIKVTGDFQEVHRAVTILDPMEEATKPEVLQGLKLIGGKNSWRNDLDQALSEAETNSDFDQTRKLVRIAYLMRVTEDPWLIRVMQRFDKRIPKKSQWYQERYQKAELGIVERARAEEESEQRRSEQRRQKAERQAREAAERIRFEMAEEEVEAEITRIQGELQREQHENQRRATKEAEKRKKEQREDEIEAQITEIQGQLQKEEVARKRKEAEDEAKNTINSPDPKKTKEWILAEQYFATEWAKVESLLPRKAPGDTAWTPVEIIQLFEASMNILQTKILDKTNPMKVEQMRAGIEYLLPKFWPTSYERSEFDKLRPISPNRRARIIFLPEQDRNKNILTDEQKDDAKKIFKALSRALHPDISTSPNVKADLAEDVHLFHSQVNNRWKDFSKLLNKQTTD